MKFYANFDFNTDKKLIDISINKLFEVSKNIVNTEVPQELHDDYQLHPNKYMAGEKEIEVDVPDFEAVTKTYEEPIYNEETGEIDHYETKTRKIQIPIMIEVPDYDNEGNITGYHQEQQTHKETVIVPYPVINPNYEQEEAQRERQRLDALTLTPSDVERALYYSDLHMDFDDLKALISEQAPQIDLKGLAIEFRANNFYRGAKDKDGNRIIDMVGLLLGYTSQDMDYLFEHKQLPIKEIVE